jgi:cysteinyl-tRNA synthetase
MDDFMNDDFSTARVLANMFELVPVINSIKDKVSGAEILSTATFEHLQQKMKVFVEDIFGLKSEAGKGDVKLKGVIEILLDLRKDARARKDWMTSDKIRNQLGI